MFAPDVDLIISFRVSKATTAASKQQTREEARKAQKQYDRLIETLTYAGLKAVGRRGEQLGHLLVFVTCPETLLESLIKRERHSDFLSGLPVTRASDSRLEPLSPADRIRLVHAYISSTPTDGGLGISSDSSDWDLVETIFPLQNRDFNEQWVKVWKPRSIAQVPLQKIREQFGDALAYYFAFLSSYTIFLIFPAILGIIAHFVLLPYSPLYSILIAIWSTFFVEWWRVHERILSLRFGTRNSFRVEKRRAQYKPGMPWWSRELRIFATIPVILLFGAVLCAILTGIFVFEAFITHLYQGPGKHLVGFSPTILFAILVPRFLAIYHALAVRLTHWENHAHQSTYTFSLTLKTFALGALVAYSGLTLSAFVYVPFGEGVMQLVQKWLFDTTITGTGFGALLRDALNTTAAVVGMHNSVITNTFGVTSESHHAHKGALWDMDLHNARTKLNPARLRDQMFAFTVTNQIVNTFLEIGLPFVLRAVASFRKRKAANGNGKGSPNSTPTMKKKVVFEDEKEKGGLEERLYLEAVRNEAALPEYDLFVDYNEMVVQFGYVALWSTIWPLAGVMAFINNVFELYSDAVKIAVHHRRPLPVRTDTIGPWLDALSVITWLSALTNSALIYLFSPSLMSEPDISTDSTFTAEKHLVTAAGALLNETNSTEAWGVDGSSPATFEATTELLLKAALVALVASHAFILVRTLIRHVVERIWWKGSEEVIQREREERELKEKFLDGIVGEAEIVKQEGVVGAGDVGLSGTAVAPLRGDGSAEEPVGFWDHDEGGEEIQRIVKEA